MQAETLDEPEASRTIGPVMAHGRHPSVIGRFSFAGSETRTHTSPAPGCPREARCFARASTVFWFSESRWA
jgi:hypothetical protein